MGLLHQAAVEPQGIPWIVALSTIPSSAFMASAQAFGVKGAVGGSAMSIQHLHTAGLVLLNKSVLLADEPLS